MATSPPTMESMIISYEQSFKKGTIVEVSSEDSGLRGSWYTATVIRTISRSSLKLLVEYHNLFADDLGSRPLREFVSAVLLRPIPPPSRRRHGGGGAFRVMDDVDAFHNDGWWEGVVTKVLEGRRYAVFFRCSREQIEFDASDLRIHREWRGGNVWDPPIDESELSSSSPSPSLSPRFDPRQKKRNGDNGGANVNGNHSSPNNGVTRNGEEKNVGQRRLSVSGIQDGVLKSGNNREVKRTSNHSHNNDKVTRKGNLREQKRGSNCTGNKLGVRRNGTLNEPRRRASNHTVNRKGDDLNVICGLPISEGMGGYNQYRTIYSKKSASSHLSPKIRKMTDDC